MAKAPGITEFSMPVQINNAAITDAWVYLASRPSNDTALRPYIWYKRFLVEGQRANILCQPNTSQPWRTSKPCKIRMQQGTGKSTI